MIGLFSDDCGSSYAITKRKTVKATNTEVPKDILSPLSEGMRNRRRDSILINSIGATVFIK